MRQHGLALFVRPHNAQRARLLPPHRTPPATSPTLPSPLHRGDPGERRARGG